VLSYYSIATMLRHEELLALSRRHRKGCVASCCALQGRSFTRKEGSKLISNSLQFLIIIICRYKVHTYL